MAVNDASSSQRNFTGTNLRYSSFPGADLRRCDLSGSDMRDADLSRADLSGSQLRFADLTRANLAGTNLEGVDMTGADLTGVRLADQPLIISVETTLGRFTFAPSPFGGAIHYGELGHVSTFGAISIDDLARVSQDRPEWMRRNYGPTDDMAVVAEFVTRCVDHARRHPTSFPPFTPGY